MWSKMQILKTSPEFYLLLFILSPACQYTPLLIISKHWFIVYQADIKWDIIQNVVLLRYNNDNPVLLLLCLLLL